MMRELNFQGRPLIIHFAIPWITVNPGFEDGGIHSLGAKT